MPFDKKHYYLNATRFGIIGDDDQHLHLGFEIPKSESPLPVNEIFFRINKDVAQEIIDLLQIHLEKMSGAPNH